MNIKRTLTPEAEQQREEAVTLGAWLGRHQAFGLIANRCTAADAECLKTMRESGDYKKLGLTWDEFCSQRAGISRAYADRIIRHLEEFGTNFFRIAELMQISGDTYRLIAGAVSEDGIDLEGRKIPLTPENRKQVIAAVETLRERSKPKRDARNSPEAIDRRLKALLEEVRASTLSGHDRLVLIGVLDAGARTLTGLSQRLRTGLLKV